MSETTAGSPEQQLKSQNGFERTDKRRRRAVAINRFRLFFTGEQRRRYEFACLREDVHLEMTSRLMERRRTNPTPTPKEAAAGILSEELEPQVRDAVFVLNRKGYKTISSGFEGNNRGDALSPEYQLIEGHFLLDGDTKARLTAMGVEVTTKPWWKWQMNECMGLTTSNTPPEERTQTTIRFKPQYPDLHQMRAKWEQIAAVLPPRRRFGKEV